jgi:hypothetical protein
MHVTLLSSFFAFVYDEGCLSIIHIFSGRSSWQTTRMTTATAWIDTALAMPLALVGLTFLLAGLVKGVVGLGLPTVAMAVLGSTMPPAEAAALLIVPSLVTNVWQLLAGRHLRTLLVRLWPMQLGVAIGTVAGSWLMHGHYTQAATVCLGITLVVYAAAGLANFRLATPPSAEPVLAPLIGSVTGIVTAATGVFVIPTVPYLQALGLEKDELVQAFGLSFTVSTIALALGLGLNGAFRPAIAGASALALIPAMAGMLLGQLVRTRVQPATFRLWLFIGLLALGAHIIIKGSMA